MAGVCSLAIRPRLIESTQAMTLFPRQSPALVLHADRTPASGGGDAARYRNPRLAIEPREQRDVPAGHLGIRLLRVGLCGTDLHLVQETAEGAIRCSSPLSVPAEGRVIGHEGVGVVEAVGTHCGPWAVGDLVCCEAIATCGGCPRCRRGEFNQCDYAALLGLEQDGLFTQWTTIPARMAHPVSDIARSDADLTGLACLAPAAVAFLACRNAALAAGESVLVLGGGPIGYFTALLAGRVFGAASVCLSEPSEFRREFARPVCDHVASPDELPSLRQSFDVLIEAAGALEELDSLLPRMKGNGRIVLLARTGAPLAIERVDELITKSLRVIGSRGHLGGSFDAVLALIRQRRLDLLPAVTRVVSGLEGLCAALHDPDGVVAGDCKVIAELGARGDGP